MNARGEHSREAKREEKRRGENIEEERRGDKRRGEEIVVVIEIVGAYLFSTC